MSDLIENGRIESTSLGPEDHGIFSAYLNLSFDGSGQSFGGYSLDAPPPVRFKGDRIGCAWGMEFIIRLMRTLEVHKWEDLKGQYCRVRRDQSRGRIVAVGHITKDRWFNPETDLASMVTATQEGR